ncbi:peptide deformylase [Komagataeibacter melaceti]|uniref:Peptide deformylase n=1 Tax=Komagataeibacter melaceti TaxID=2766577 RepID=A0A371Z1G0_9PROT|nr:peptide deformylase [Komagataeibacter melaceti]RFD20342.1 peptide deformylase [Komagataeibacter melaceti]
MTLLKIARMGHPVLLQPAQAVPDPLAPSIRTLVADMIETMLDAGGVGLAAPQVHQSLRLFVYHIPTSRSSGPKSPPCPPSVLINPSLEPVDDQMVDRMEGCLSIPGLRGWVPRYERIAYSGVNEQGDEIRGIASGFLANVFQHEYDHLNGILYPMRMTDLGRMGFDTEMARYGEPA